MAELGEASGSAINAKDGLPKRIAFRSVPSFEDMTTEEPPENFMMNNFTRPRAGSHHLSSKDIPTRKALTARARWWRGLMRLGMKFHGWALPRPPKPDFVRTIETDTIPIELYFYVPKAYTINYQRERGHQYPMIVNFHGGGFTLGDATDDRYFARVVLKYTSAVFISVNYRRAPEHPFPAAVDDSVEALMYLSSHATELRIDPTKTVLTGFSAGGNLSFTVPFRLTYYTNPNRPRLYPSPGSAIQSRDVTPNISRVPTKTSIQAGLNPQVDGDDDLNPRAAASTEMLLPRPTNMKSNGPAASSKTSREPSPSDQPRSEQLIDSINPAPDGTAHVHFRPSQLEPPHHLQPSDDSQNQSTSFSSPNASKPTRPKPLSRKSSLNPDRPSNLRILSIVAWYPLLDWTSSRSAKVRSSRKPSATLKKTFTDLFDHSYLPPPDDARSHISPYASPGLAPPEMIQDGLPTKIQLWLCEYDMLLAEGEEFVKRLSEHGKEVYSETIPQVPHGWDKSPNPFRNQNKIDKLYERSARYVQAVFDEAEENPAEFRGERISVGGLR